MFVAIRPHHHVCADVPSPNGLHYEWAMKSLEAGFHVLCEKPFASNAAEARARVEKAREKGLVLMEAAHWWYHPFRQRMQAIIASGVLGDVRKVYGARARSAAATLAHALSETGADADTAAARSPARPPSPQRSSRSPRSPGSRCATPRRPSRRYATHPHWPAAR